MLREIGAIIWITMWSLRKFTRKMGFNSSVPQFKGNYLKQVVGVHGALNCMIWTFC